MERLCTTCTSTTWSTLHHVPWETKNPAPTNPPLLPMMLHNIVRIGDIRVLIRRVLPMMLHNIVRVGDVRVLIRRATPTNDAP